MKKRLWLRWGLSAALIDVVAQVVLLVIINPFADKSFLTGSLEAVMATIIGYLYLVFSFPAALIEPFLNSIKYLPIGDTYAYLMLFTAGTIVSAIGYFIIGSLCGLVYEKIKKIVG